MEQLPYSTLVPGEVAPCSAGTRVTIVRTLVPDEVALGSHTLTYLGFLGSSFWFLKQTEPLPLVFGLFVYCCIRPK